MLSHNFLKDNLSPRLTFVFLAFENQEDLDFISEDAIFSIYGGDHSHLFYSFPVPLWPISIQSWAAHWGMAFALISILQCRNIFSHCIIFLINLFFIGVQFTNIQNNIQCSSRQVPPSVPVGAVLDLETTQGFSLQRTRCLVDRHSTKGKNSDVEDEQHRKISSEDHGSHRMFLPLVQRVREGWWEYSSPWSNVVQFFY